MGAVNTEKTSAVSEPRSVPYGIKAGMKVADLKDETLVSFNDSPFEFEDSTANLWGDTQKVYYNACVANRFSENYLMLCDQLEKNIRQLGSLCLTKAALEQKGLKFPKLADMNIHALVKMVSFHFRKAHAALEGVYIDNNILALSYLNWEFRWVGLGNRLKATEVKIQKIKAGEIKTENMIRKAEAVTDDGAIAAPKFGTHHAFSDKTSSALPAAASSLPINSSIIRKVMEENVTNGTGTIVSSESELEPDEPEILSEEDIRDVLIADALQRQDQEAIPLIQIEDAADLIDRFDRYLSLRVRDILPP